MTESIEVFTQSSIRIKSRIGTIYIDPFGIEDKPHDADFIFLTHDHSDHYSPDELEKVAGENTILIAPVRMRNRIEEDHNQIKKIVLVRPGMFYTANGLEFDTVAAYNTLKPFHPKRAQWVGYILRLDRSLIWCMHILRIRSQLRVILEK